MDWSGVMSNFIMYADDLLSKWGFGDGDSLSEYLDEYVSEDLRYKITHHKLLEELVKRYLLPELEDKVEIFYIETIHNPIRAEMINGKYYTNHYSHDDCGLLGDTEIRLDKSTIEEVIIEMSGAKNL